MTAVVRSSNPSPSPPPAVWAAFARQGRWKNWVMLAQLALIAILMSTNTHLASRPPDVVLVQPDGKSTFVERSLVGESILAAIQAQKGQPSDPTVVHFTREFLGLVLGVNSSTIDAAWPQALSQMDPALAAKLSREYAQQKVLEAWKLANVKTELSFRGVELVGRTDTLLHVRAVADRVRSGLMTGADPTRDRVQVDLVHAIVPRTLQRPDGLEVRDFRITVLQDPESSPAGGSVSPTTAGKASAHNVP